MAISLICPKCKKIKAPEQLAGKKGACPVCKTIVDIPRQRESEATSGALRPDAAPSLSQRPIPRSVPVGSKPEVSDSIAGMSRQTLLTLIALPCIAVVVAMLVIWSYERSRAQARRQEAQIAADKVFTEARQSLEQKNIPGAMEKLKVYISDENATKKSEATKLLAEVELVTSQDAASETLVKMGDEAFQRFQQSQQHNDVRVVHPVLAKLWNTNLVAVLPEAKRKRDEAEAKRVAEIEKHKREQLASTPEGILELVIQRAIKKIKEEPDVTRVEGEESWVKSGVEQLEIPRSMFEKQTR